MTKVSIITYGCSSNLQDSLVMTSLIKNSEYEFVNDYNQADIVIINSCTVKQKAETKFWKTIKDLKLKNKKIIAAGCVPQADEKAVKQLIEQKISIIGVKDTDKIINAIKSEDRGNHVIINKSKTKKFTISSQLNNIIGIITINEGCLGSCSYCKTKFARGNLQSYSIRDLKLQMISHLKNNATEIWITSQDSAAYGLDIETNLVELLKELLKTDQEFFIRIGMMNPNNAKLIINNLINLINNDERIFRFLHIPIQSANNRILKLMRRPYSKQDLVRLFKKIKEEIPNITISTDVICGFPTETNDEFKETLEFIEWLEPDVLNISRFWPRPNTEAAKMPQFYNQIAIKRAKEIRELHNKISKENNKKWINWQGKALIDEIGKNNTLIARNKEYKQIIIDKNQEKHKENLNNQTNKNQNLQLGSLVNVKVTESKTFDLKGNLI